MEREMKQETLVKQSLILLMFVTGIVTIYEVATAISRFIPGDNLFDFSMKCSTVVPYCFVLIFALLGAFPVAYLLFREKGISLGKVIIQKEYIIGDIGLGLVGGVLASLISLIFHRGIIHFALQTKPTTFALGGADITLYFVTLVIVSGIFKEIYYRGFAQHFLKDIVGEKTAFWLTNILFGILDWGNLGASFISGVIWSKIYQKRNRLIVPIIAHGFLNFLSIGYLIIMAHTTV